jgi:hypothetical protein
LDWLACEFLERGYSLKAMHRLLMLSSSYRMGSSPNPIAQRVDPQNDRFWRFDARRLSAEEIRDAMLFVNGTLNPKQGGPGVYPKMPAEVLATSSRPDAAWGRSSPEEAARRSIYIHVKRSLLSPFLTVFDLADTDSSCPVRFATTQPTQALTLLNSEFAHQQARLLAARLEREAHTVRDRVARGLELVTCRPPLPQQIDAGVKLLLDLVEREGLGEPEALAHLALALYNLNEFVTLD